MNKKFFQNWDKRIAQYNAQREKEEAKIAKAKAEQEKGKIPKPAPKAQPATDLDMSELQKRLRF